MELSRKLRNQKHKSVPERCNNDFDVIKDDTKNDNEGIRYHSVAFFIPGM